MHNIMSKLFSRFYHDIISSLSSVQMCLYAKQYDLAMQSVNDTLKNIMNKRDLILNSNDTLSFAISLIQHEYPHAEIIKEKNNLIIKSKYFDKENIFINIACTFLEELKIQINHDTHNN